MHVAEWEAGPGRWRRTGFPWRGSKALRRSPGQIAHIHDICYFIYTGKIFINKNLHPKPRKYQDKTGFVTK